MAQATVSHKVKDYRGDINLGFCVICCYNPRLASLSHGLIIRDMETSSYLYFIARVLACQ